MNENKYRTLTEKLSVPEKLNERVAQAARRQGQMERAVSGWKDAGERRPGRRLLRGAVCAACALALVAGTLRTVGNGETADAPGTVLPAFSFGLTAYAADTGETVAPNANGGLAILSGDGQLDPERGGFTGSLFQVTGEGIQTVSLSIDRGGLYRNRLRTDLTQEEMAAARMAMEEGTVTPAAISQDENGVWSMPEMTVLGASVTEDFDPETQYGFWIPPEELVTDREEGPEQFHANVDFFDGAVLTVTVTLADGSSQSRDYRLSTGRLKVVWEEDGTRLLLPQLAGEEDPYLYGVYAVDQQQSRWLAWPVQGSRMVSLSNPYGTVNGRTHTGIDIPASEGEVILAAADGTVIETGFDPEQGNYVVLDHGGGLTTLYGQCQSVDVEQGDTVRAGEMIGAVGSSGMSTGPHLHFEVRQDGEHQDPVAYFDSEIRETLRAELPA